MMSQNVVLTYGADRFPNMDLCAKSGTAEVGGGKQPSSWFTGFLRDQDFPYAFAVVVEEGGSGAGAGPRTVTPLLSERSRAVIRASCVGPSAQSIG